MNRMCKEFHQTKLYDCPSCGKELRSYMGELYAEIGQIPKEEKQSFLDFVTEGKGNLGEAVDFIDPTGKYQRACWYQILVDQIEHVGYEKINPILKQG